MSATTAQAHAPDRLALALFLAAVLHGLIILGVGFSQADPAKRPPRDVLEITLATLPEQQAPEHHDFLAQADQEGGGDLDDRARPREPSHTHSRQAGLSQQQRREQTRRAHRDSESLISSEATARERARRQDSHRPAPRALEPINLRPTRTSSARQAEFDPSPEAAGARGPSKHFISAATRAHAAADYMRRWIDRVEQVGNLNYPEQARRLGLSGSLVLDVTLRADGSVADIRINRPSPHPALDQAAMRIVQLAAPYPAVAAEVRQGREQLVITRTWRFSAGGLSTR
ncbi:energy transducer TonB [Alkalilimnicola sp. S0819]|uniref:energy transducer TonB n=1 Tax=Alkalilimnicola sp. S0819 TaxID=2613922 RepID=UPI0012619BF8|nr:energy transducer TonB [Alkalilimnicola sp. S0819]KAB7624466.1 energy transducer TonB [Alkalilimnicola sp. S0819]MPQ16302.1 TonB family protein [Alkalilimnicola sp. S0819]